MRIGWLFSVGISLVGCKDDRPATPSVPTTPVPAPVTARSAPPAPAPVDDVPVARHTDRPRLSEQFSAEAEDKAWADATEQAIKAVAPGLTNVTCRQTQCEATVIAASSDELARLTDQIQEPDALPSTSAKNVLLTLPTTEGGKTSMKIYIRYDR